MDLSTSWRRQGLRHVDHTFQHRPASSSSSSKKRVPSAVALPGAGADSGKIPRSMAGLTKKHTIPKKKTSGEIIE